MPKKISGISPVLGYWWGPAKMPGLSGLPGLPGLPWSSRPSRKGGGPPPLVSKKVLEGLAFQDFLVGYWGMSRSAEEDVYFRIPQLARTAGFFLNTHGDDRFFVNTHGFFRGADRFLFF